MRKLLAAVAITAMLLVAQAVMANTLVSTINGYYDVDAYDTPSLNISNTTGFDFTNVVLTLTGYQGDNNGHVQTMNLPDIVANSNTSVIWGTGCGNAGAPCTTANQVVQTPNTGLFAYDYDDTDGGHTCLFPDPAGNNQYINGGLCGQPGNFYVTLTAIWNGQNIYSQFSPNTNATGGFVGWEGLDQQGYSETVFDSHSNGGPNGVLANIYVGTPPPIPEPSTLVLFGTGLIGLGSKAWKRFIG